MCNYSPSLDIIKPSENVLDLGISMSSNCSFAYHINVLTYLDGSLDLSLPVIVPL